MHMASETLSVFAIVFYICLPINQKNKRQFNFLPLIKYLYFIFRITPTIDKEPDFQNSLDCFNNNYNRPMAYSLKLPPHSRQILSICIIGISFSSICDIFSFTAFNASVSFNLHSGGTTRSKSTR